MTVASLICFCWNHKCLTWCRYIAKQSVIQQQSSVHYTEEPQLGQNSCLCVFHLCWMTGGKAIRDCHSIGFPHTNTGVVGRFGEYDYSYIAILTTGANTLLALVQLALCGGGCMCWLCTHFLNHRYIETERVVVSHPDITHEHLRKLPAPSRSVAQ